MGYGLDTKKYIDRKWPKSIVWTGDAKGKLSDGMLAWENAAGVKFVKSTGAKADFKIEWTNKVCQWDSKSKGNGRPDKGKEGILRLVETSSIGTVIHELGHLLGLSHEQDHPTHRKTYYATDKGFGLYGANVRAAENKDYGGYDANSVMHYPESHYGTMVAPSAGDIVAVKQINGW